jgi:fibronectin-binding autotransporter adhesin
VNYFGKFDATVSDAPGKHPGGHLFSETVHASHAPSDAIIVPDAQLLFGGEFKRAGVDLVLSGDGREFVLHDYFKGEKHAPLASPDGAHLTGDLVNALAGQVQIAQAGGAAAAGQVIGHVTKLAGTATAVRNGVSIILNNGDNVEKGDVVASGSDSTVGITFIDGTVFGLSSNARMVLNEMVYDPNGSNNSSLLSLVAGTITFVAGETAKHGDMKVDTPVATMGIRGTAVLVEIDFSVPGATPDAKFQVLVEPDGTTGSYILFDKTTLTPLAVVDKAGMQINVSNGVMSQTLAPLSPEIQKLITDVFSLKFSDSTNTKAIEHFTDSIVPNVFGPVQFALANGNVVTFSAPPPGAATAAAAAPTAATIGHQPIAPQINSADPGKITELPHVTNSTAVDKVTGQIQYYDVNVTDHDTVSVKISSFTYQDAKGHDVTGSLTSLQLADIANVEAAVTVSGNTGPNAGGFGSATWNYSVTDKAFDFLAAGETLTLTYTPTVDNNYQPLDQTGPGTITITITGTNDAPVITSPQQNVSFVSSGTDTKGGELIPNTATHGTLAFTDPDLTDTHTVAVKMTSTLLDGHSFAATVGQTVIDELSAAVTVSISNGGQDSTGTGVGTIAWTLANLQVYLADLVPDGESLVLTYAVTVTDSATPPATSVQDIVVTVGGNNQAAVVWVNVNPLPQGGVALWSTASNWEGDRAPSILGTDDVIIGTDQVLPGTPVFPATVNDAEAAKSLTMDYFTDFGTSIPELDVLSTGSLTIVDALNMDTSTDAGSPLTAESIIKNFGTISVGGIAELLKHSVLDNYGTITLPKGGVFGDQSSITNSGTIEVVSGTLDVEVGIANFVTTTVDNPPVTTPGLIQIDGGATLKLSDGATITKGEVTLGNLSVLDVEKGAASLPAGTPDATLDGVTVTGTGGLTPSTIEIGALGAATLLLDDGTIIKNGDLTISAGSALDITAIGATLDGVNVTGTNGSSGGAGAMLGGLEAHAGVLVSASTIEVGTTATTGTVLTLDDGTTITNGNLIIDSGNTLDIESSQGATLDGVNVMNSGTIQVACAALATTVTLVLDGGTTVTDGTLLIHDPLSTGEGIVEIGAGGATFDDVTVTNNNLLKVDSGATLTLEDGTTIAGGTVTVEAGGSLDVDASGATLDDLTLSGSVTNSGTLTIKDTVTLDGATINGGTIDDTGTITGYGAISSVIAGLGALTASGGTLTLSGLNTYSGVTTIDSGAVLAAGVADAFSASSAVTDNGELDLGTTDQTIAALNGTNTAALVGSFSGTGTGPAVLTINNGGSFAGVVEDGSAGAATALMLAGGTLTLTGDNLYTGVTTINGGTLKLSGAGSIAGSSDVVDDGTLDISGTSGASIVTLSGDGTVTLGAETLTLSDASTTFSGAIDGSGGLTLTTGTETLTGDNLYTGATTINGGTLKLSGAGSIAGSSDVVDNGTFDISGTSGASIVTLSGDGAVTLGAETLTLSDASTTFSGAIDGSGGLTLTTGTETLTGDNLYTGVTTINGGTLALSGSGSIADSSDVIDDGTFDISTTTSGASIVTLSGTGTVDLDTETLTLSDASTTFSGAIDGSGGLTLTTGTLTLTGDNLYTGVTTINGGTLKLSGLGSIAGSSDVVDDGTFDISGTTSGASIVTLSGDGAVTLGTETLTLSDASTTFSGAIDGSGGLTLTTGTETLTGDNLYTGVTTINGGTLALSGSGSIADSSDVIDNGTLDISATTSGASIVTLSGNGAVKLGSETLTLSDASTTFSGAIDGSGGLTLTAGTETLTGDNLYTGVTTINGGTLALSGSGSIAGSSDVVDDGTFDISGTTSGASIVTLSGDGAVTLGTETLTLSDASTTFSGAIDGSGGLTLTTGTETLTGDNLYTGVTTINGGTLALSGSGSIADSSDVIDNGTLDISATTSGASIVTLSGNGAVKLGSETLTLSDASTTFSGAIDGSGGLTLTAGTETLTGDNLYTGVTTINGGTLALSGSGSIADSSDVIDDGTFDISGTTSGASIVTLSGTGTVDLGTETLTLSDASTTFSGAIDGSGGLTLTTGTETLTGDNLYTGVTTINGGTLALSGSGSIADSSDVIDDGTFDISGTTSGASIATLSGNGTVALGSKTLTLSDASTTFSGAIDGSGGLTLTAGTETLTAGTETLTGDNLYTGVTTINGGTLALSGSIADSSDVIDDGTFDISTTTSGASIVTLSGNGTVTLGSKTLTLSNASTTFSGAIGGTGGLALLAGMLTLTGDSTYSGTTTISGTLALSGSGSIADSSDVIDNGTFDISATTSDASIVTLSGNGAVKLGSETLTLTKANNIFSGVISGNGGLTVAGTGTETLSGINTFSGATTIGSGETLSLSGSGSIAHSSDVIDNGTLDISATTSGASIVTLSGNGTVKLGAETLTLSDASTTFSGTIGGTGGLTLTAGTETLAGNNLYTGVTTINGGTLALKDSGSIAHSSDVIDDGTFDISATTSGASIVTLSGNGAVTLGAETLTLSNASTTFSGTIGSTGGGITVASGTLTLGTMILDDLTLAGSFSNSGTLTIDDTVTFHGVTMSGGTLDISGTLDSTGTTLISGATIINSDHIDVVSGTFTVDPTPFTNNGTFEVQSSAVFSGEVVTNSQGVVVQIDQEVVTNTHGVIQIDHGGTLTLFDTTINGGTIIDNGTLLLTGTTSKLENVTFTGTATLDISSHSTLEIGGSVSGVTVNFDASSGHSGLILDNPYSFQGVVNGLVESSSGNENDENYIDLMGFADSSQHPAKVLSAVYNSHTGITAVTIVNGIDKPLTIDLDGNYSQRDIEFASDHNGGTLFSDPAADSGAVSIDSGRTLDIGGASTATVTFTNSTGTTGDLVLADSKDFTGAIVGFTGDGTTANSDLIDVTDVSIADVATSKTTYADHGNGTGTLTLYDANGHALDSINFDGNYQLANFTIESDGNGGTLIVDPPVNNNSPAPANTTVASNQNLTGTAGTDGFVFNFDGHHHAPTTDFHPDQENSQPGGPMLTNLHTGSNAAPDPGMPAGGDGHDHIGLSAFAKAHLNAVDFHFV